MSKRTVTLDDLNGDEQAVPVVITVNGKGVELDLADRSAAKLAKALEPFFGAGTERAYVVERRHNGQLARDRRTDADRGFNLAELRAWAERNNVGLPSRGRIPQTIVDQFMTGR